jgi:hypothetical protein
MRGLAAAAAALVLAAGCGGGAASTPGPSPHRSTPAISDSARAEAMLPRASDLPSRWMSGSDPAASALRCAPDDSGIVETSYAGPESFTDAAGFPAVTGAASVWKTEQDAATAFRRSASPDAFACLARQFRRDFAVLATRGFHIGPATMAVPPLNRVGDETRAEQVELAVTYKGSTAFFYVDYVFFRVGRSVVSIDGFQRDDTFDNDLLGRIAARLAARGGDRAPA